MGAPNRVVVIGAGVVGLSTAYYCARRGFEVTVLERDQRGHSNCSTGNAGMVVPSHFEPLASPGMVWRGLRMILQPESPFSFSAMPSPELASWAWRFWRASTAAHVARCAPILAALHLMSRACYEDLNEVLGGDFGFSQRGMSMLCTTEEGLREESVLAARARALGLQAEVLRPKDFAEREPGLDVQVAGAVHYPEDCHLTPARFLELLEAKAAEIGVRVYYGQGVHTIQTRGHRVAAFQTDDEDFGGDSFVLAAGVWTADLAREVGVETPLAAGRGYSMTLARPPQTPSTCLLLKEARVAITPMLGGLRVAGTLQFSDLDLAVDPHKAAGIRKSVCRFLPAFGEDVFEGAPVWCGLRPMSADGMPYVGPTRRYSNLQIAAGHGMMGLSLGPATGKLIAQCIAGDTPAIDLRLMDPDRYA